MGTLKRLQAQKLIVVKMFLDLFWPLGGNLADRVLKKTTRKN